MRTTLFTIMLVGVIQAETAFAASIELFPTIGSVSGKSLNSNLTSSSISSTDVKTWLGDDKTYEWYSTTGNGDMRWGYASSNINSQTLTLPNMPGTGGVCAGTKFHIDRLESYSDFSFSFTLTPPGVNPTYTYSIYYETIDGEIISLSKESRTGQTSNWDVTYDFTSEQVEAIKSTGNGDFYIVFGSNAGNNGANATIGNISLKGTQAIPEPTTATLSLLGLGALLLRRRRV